MSFVINERLRESIVINMTKLERWTVEDEGLRRAAVAVVVAPSEKDDSACILLTRRPASIKRHAAQIAFPGGRFEPGETAEQAALRETREEVGLTLSSEDIIGLLDDFPTRSGFAITPVVFWCGKRAHLEPDPNEVDRVFYVPFAEINDPQIPQFINPDGIEGDRVFCAPLSTIGHEVYAPTAAILYQFRELCIRGEVKRVSDLEQPQFAWQ